MTRKYKCHSEATGMRQNRNVENAKFDFLSAVKNELF